MDAILGKKREKERDDREWLARVNGMEINKQQSDVQRRIEEVKRQAAAQLAGSEANLEREELTALGFGFG